MLQENPWKIFWLRSISIGRIQFFFIKATLISLHFLSPFLSLSLSLSIYIYIYICVCLCVCVCVCVCMCVCACPPLSLCLFLSFLRCFGTWLMCFHLACGVVHLKFVLIWLSCLFILIILALKVYFKLRPLVCFSWLMNFSELLLLIFWFNCFYRCLWLTDYIYIYIYIYIYVCVCVCVCVCVLCVCLCVYQHQVLWIARISMTFSHQPFLSVISHGRSCWLQPVFTRYWK